MCHVWCWSCSCGLWETMWEADSMAWKECWLLLKGWQPQTWCYGFVIWLHTYCWHYTGKYQVLVVFPYHKIKMYFKTFSWLHDMFAFDPNRSSSATSFGCRYLYWWMTYFRRWMNGIFVTGKLPWARSYRLVCVRQADYFQKPSLPFSSSKRFILAAIINHALMVHLQAGPHLNSRHNDYFTFVNPSA
jgi:hypothetical protein